MRTPPPDTSRSARRETFAEALRIPTVTPVDGEHRSEQPFIEWQRFLRNRFPEIHAQLHVQTPDPWRTTMEWRGTREDLPPVLLMAHYDVVPASPEGWIHPPFGGVYADGCVWGRGSRDNKLAHIAILLAVEELLQEGFTPCRRVFLAFGGDEETGGERGAAVIAREYRARGVSFAMVLDEGAAVARNILPGVADDAALIGCGEKGHINVEVTGHHHGGHAATPGKDDAAVQVARALVALLRRPLPAGQTATVTAFIRALGREVPGPAGWMLRNYPRTAPVVHRVLSRRGETDAMLRSTMAVTMLHGSDAPNVLPTRPWANINIRLLPGDTAAAVLTRLKRRAGNTPVDIHLAPRGDNNEAPPESPSRGIWYEHLAATIRHSLETPLVLPYLVTATTDSRHYAGLTENIYRFVPMTVTPEDLQGIHGHNERVDARELDRAVAFYRSFITRLPEDETP